MKEFLLERAMVEKWGFEKGDWMVKRRAMNWDTSMATTMVRKMDPSLEPPKVAQMEYLWGSS